MILLSVAEWQQALTAAGFVVEACFRCFDPRPVDPGMPEAERRAEEDFRKRIGSLALRGLRR